MMAALVIEPPVLAATALIEAKALLRLDTVDEEALLAAQLRTALDLAEDFTGSVWLGTTYREKRALRREIILHKRPFTALTALRIIYANGSEAVLDASRQETQRTDHGEAMLSMPDSVLDGRDVLISYRAGMCDDWSALPEGLRMGVLRMAAHLFTWRDDAMAVGVPGAVAALWRPYKSLRLM
jgi:uncharacterized phiE125 gp8 family phage protein